MDKSTFTALPSTAEFGSELYKKHASKTTFLESKTAFICGKPRELKLEFHTGGYRIAGSCAAKTKPRYSVTFMIGNSRNGKSHREYFAAWEDYESYQTKPA
jgi:hypothetical protein